MRKDIEDIRKQAIKEISGDIGLKELDIIYKKYLGKKGKVAEVFYFLKTADVAEKKIIGKEINLVKKELEELFKKKKAEKEIKSINIAASKEKIDITIQSKKIPKGHLHPITLTKMECENIFQTMGFEIVEGPEVESEWYNFDVLNMPKDHPARDIQDTFWIKQEISKDSKKNFLPRTQTSAVQVKYMEKNNPPLRIVVPGRVFRNEATDMSHEAQFYQMEGLFVDKDISVSNFKAIIKEFLKRFFKTNIEIRLRPGYFPFTEPSFEIDARNKANGNWLELIGAGMVHPNVFKSAGYDPRQWQGFAFGVGLDRLTMVKHKINDIRLFYQNDLRFLEQF